MPDPGRTIDVALAIWFVLTALSVGYVGWDAFTRNPELKVMRYGWVLVTLYTGPIGGALYVLSCQEEPTSGTHERFIVPLWKQGLGSTIHCLAGDATGIIAAAIVTSVLGLPMGIDSVIEYVFGFGFGLLIFQALFMRTMLGGSYVTALRRTLLPEWVSMNTVMAGMFPVMLVLQTRHMSAMDPTGLRFWGVMSLATVTGLVIAYPANVWLVASGLKHGMGTKRVLGKGGSPISETVHPHPAQDMSAMSMQVTGKHDVHEPDMQMGPMIRATAAQIVAVSVLTLVALGAGVLLGVLYGNPGIRPGSTMQMTALTACRAPEPLSSYSCLSLPRAHLDVRHQL